MDLEFFETEEISPIISADSNNSQFETDYVPDYSIDSHLTYTQSGSAGGGETSPAPIISEDNNYDLNIPDAIQETEKQNDIGISNNSYSETPYIDDGQESALPNIILDVGKQRQEDIEQSTSPDSLNSNEEDSASENNLGNIYRLLDERLPEYAQETENAAESISEEETESLILQDIYASIDNIKQYESEQLNVLEEIKNQDVIHSNNDYHIGIITISVVCTIWGSVAIGHLFRNIK